MPDRTYSSNLVLGKQAVLILMPIIMLSEMMKCLINLKKFYLFFLSSVHTMLAAFYLI